MFYRSVNLWHNGKTVHRLVHRLVAEAFIPNPNGYPIINHIDENPANNKVTNLEWCTYKYNAKYGKAQERRQESLREGKKNEAV